jgi:hypothetical protein
VAAIDIALEHRDRGPAGQQRGNERKPRVVPHRTACDERSTGRRGSHMRPATRTVPASTHVDANSVSATEAPQTMHG